MQKSPLATWSAPKNLRYAQLDLSTAMMSMAGEGEATSERSAWSLRQFDFGWGISMRSKILLCVLALSSCGAAPHKITDRDDFLAEATRRYKGEDRERVIRAAETVIKHSDPADVEVRYTAAGFTALRKYFIYAVFATASGREKWEFTVEDAPGAKVASISISEAGTSTGGYTATPYENTMNAFPLYRLFWKRVDYMLGLRPDWAYCAHEEEAVRAAGQNPTVALSGLCGPTSEGRDAPPPQPFAPATSTPTTRAPALAGH